MRKKGSARAIVAGLLFLIFSIVMLLGYSIMSGVYGGGIYNLTKEEVVGDTEATSVINLSEYTWQFWPFFAFFAFIIIAWAITGKREYYYR